MPVPSAETTQAFRFLKQFNDEPFSKKVVCKDRLRVSDTRWFPGDLLSSVFARELCERRAMPFKEVLESFEFFACVRRRIRSRSVADLCCGHGLVGILFAMFQRDVERVWLLDKTRPPSFDLVLAAAQAVAPWTRDKVEYVEAPIKQVQRHVEDGTAILGVHACGGRTDSAIEHAVALQGPIAVLPCCRSHKLQTAPDCLKQALGPDVAIDVDRTYRLINAGYRVRWDRISPLITSQNRVLLGRPG